MSRVKLNHGVVALTFYRTRSERQYGREWMPRALAILRRKRK